jgi:uncharacterized protein VirK/YbjX
MVFKLLSVSRGFVYAEFVRIIGKNFTEKLRYYFVAPLKVIAHKRSLKKIKEVFKFYPHSTMKGLTEYQLVNQSLFSSTLSPGKRLNILSFQYRFLYQRLTSQQRVILIDDGATCWEKTFDDCSHRIVLKISQRYEYEGCLSLVYFVGDRDIYIISFTVCAGVDFDMDDPLVILISRVQGMKGKYVDIATASKQLIDIHPASALMAALEGLGVSLGVKRIIGVGAKNQVSVKYKDLEQAKIQYDEFWNTFETCSLQKSGDYMISIPFPQKSTKLIRSKFRKRTLAKRSLKKDISKEVQTSCDEMFSFRNSKFSTVNSVPALAIAG